MKQKQLTFLNNEACTIKDMKEYLNRFNDNEKFSLVVVNSKDRLHYIAKEIFLIGDMPAILMDTCQSESLDKEVI